MITIIFYHDEPGETLSLLLRDAAGAVVNGEGDELTEGSGLRYAASVAESLSGWYVAQIFEGDGNLLYTGNVKVANDGGMYQIDDPQAGIPSIPTAGQNATAVWAAEDRSLTEFDFESEVDPAALSAALQEALAEGVDVRSFLTSALSQLAGTRVIYANVPALNGQQLSAPLVRGDSYSAAIGSAIEFSRSDFPDLPEGTTAVLTARKGEAETPVSFTISGTEASIPVRTGAKVVRFEPTAAQTVLWEPGKYEFDVQLTWPDGKTRTFVGPNVFLRVLADVSEFTDSSQAG